MTLCVATQFRPVEVEAAADLGTGQADRTGAGVASDPCPAQGEHPAAEPVGVQWPPAGMFELASVQSDESQPGTLGEDTFLQETVTQQETDIGGEVARSSRPVILAPPKPQPVPIRVSRAPPA